MIKGCRMTGVLAWLLAAPSAYAQDAAPKMFKFSGFMTLGAANSSEKNADFTANYLQPDGPGFTRSTDVGPDSKAGFQVDGRFTDWLSGVVQVVADHRYDKTYTPYINMANLKVQALPGLAFRAGRLPFAAYLISDYQKVGYSTPWVRPPVEVYQFNPLSNVDGVDVILQHNIGSVAFSWQLLGGSSLAKLPQSNAKTEFKGKEIAALALSANHGSATYRAYYLQMKGTLESPTLDSPGGPFDLLRRLPAAFGGNPALADQYQIKGDRITYLSLGYNYDPGDWFLMAEATRNAGDENLLFHATSGYLTTGIHLDAWTPYLTLANKKTDSPTTHANPIVQLVIAGSNQAQSSLSLGVRWDFRANMDLKLQVDRVKHDTGSFGALVNAQPPFKTGGSYTLISACLDLVF